MYSAEQDEVGDVYPVLVNYRIELSQLSAAQKMSDTSICDTVKRCRKLNWDVFILKSLKLL